MASFCNSLLLTSVVTCLFAVSSGTHYPSTIYLDNYCGTTFTVVSDVRIQLSWKSYLSSNLNCRITLVPYGYASLGAQFRSYSMSYSYTSETGNCQTESIQLYNDGGKAVLSNSLEFCSTWRPSSQYILGRNGTFQLTTHNPSFIYTATVDLLISEITIKNVSSGSCPSGYFDCQNNYCVTQDVTCNGYNDCGNNRDEIEGCGVTRVGLIAGAVAGVIIFIVIVIVLSFWFRRYRRRAVYVQHY